MTPAPEARSRKMHFSPYPRVRRGLLRICPPPIFARPIFVEKEAFSYFRPSDCPLRRGLSRVGVGMVCVALRNELKTRIKRAIFKRWQHYKR